MTHKHRKKEKSIKELIQWYIDHPPTIRGYSNEQLSDISGVPWPHERWHLERAGRSGAIADGILHPRGIGLPWPMVRDGPFKRAVR